MRFRFPPSHRLHFPWEYRRFFESPMVFRSGHFTVFQIPNNLGHFRLGVTLKLRARSVDRNLIKRTLREWFRTHAETLGSYDYNVVMSSKQIGTAVRYPLSLRLKDGLERDFRTKVTTRRGA